MCGQAGIPPPTQFLKDITHKIHGPSGAEEKLDIIKCEPNDTRWVFTLGSDKVEGKARSKKNAKHMAAQDWSKNSPSKSRLGQMNQSKIVFRNFASSEGAARISLAALFSTIQI